jgi:nucleotide-binding universal stress UspA family protein
VPPMRTPVQLHKILVHINPARSDDSAERAATQLALAARAQLVTLTIPARGVPAIEIIRAAEQEQADLIVLWRSPADLAEGTVRRARVPCLLVSHDDVAFRRILAAVDAGPNSADILQMAITMGELLGSEVDAIHVERGAPVGTTTRAATPQPGAVAVATSPEMLVRQGDPVVEILSAVREEGIDLLVLGHHRGGPLNGHETGSIAPRLLERAPCAVLTVPI